MTTLRDNEKSYKSYLQRIHRCHIQLSCLVCGETKKPNEFKQHFEAFHPHLENTCCWCLKYSWPAHEKSRHAKHLLDCFNRLLLNFKVSSKGPESSNTADLNKFQTRLARMSNCRYICPWQNFSCSQQLKPGEMEKHFRTEHSPFDPTASCVWCEGAFSWPRGQKNQNVDHLESCFENYRRKERELSKPTCSTRRAPSPPSEYEQFEAAYFSNYDCFQYVENFLGREKVLPHLEEAYKPVMENFQRCTWFPTTLPNTYSVGFESVVERSRYFLDCFRHMNHVSEEDDGAYEENDDEDEIGKGKEMTGASATWYHVMISAYAFEKFILALKAFGEEKVFALPFWCWCDGGRYEKAVFRHHRHMILVVENGRDFKTKCWNKLSRVVHNKQYKKKRKVEEEEAILQEPLPDGFYFGRSKMIKTWLHLANTMRYLSLPQSGCRYHFEKLSRQKNIEENDFSPENEVKKRKKKPKRKIQSDRHYFMGSGWHPMQMLCLSLTAGRNGLYAVLHQENRLRSKSLDVERVFRWPADQKNAPWYIHLGSLTKECEIVLPVQKYWRPEKVISANERWLYEEGLHGFLNLMDGDKLLFVKDDSLMSLSDDEWFQAQKKGGNFFYNVIADYRLKLSRSQQTIFNTGQRMVEVNNKEWKIKMKQFEKDKESLQKDKESLQKDKEKLQKDYDVLQKDKEILQKDYDVLERSYKLLKNQILARLIEEPISNKRKKKDDQSAKNNCNKVTVLNFNS